MAVVVVKRIQQVKKAKRVLVVVPLQTVVQVAADKKGERGSPHKH